MRIEIFLSERDLLKAKRDLLKAKREWSDAVGPAETDGDVRVAVELFLWEYLNLAVNVKRVDGSNVHCEHRVHGRFRPVRYQPGLPKLNGRITQPVGKEK